jgi:hypothetical protein
MRSRGLTGNTSADLHGTGPALWAGAGRNEVESERMSDVGRSEKFAADLYRSRTYTRPEPAGTNLIQPRKSP